jgi:SAM-dependent methyltransferase
MTTPTTRMTVSDIAKLAGVQRATVSNWQRRHDDFPKPLRDVPGRPQFDGAAVRNWLAKHDPNRYPNRPSDSGRAADVVRTWRYIVNFVEYESPSDPLAVLIAKIGGEDPKFSSTGDERHPVGITVDSLDATLRTTESEADAIREFLRTGLDGVDVDELINAVTDEFDDLGRWRRTEEAVKAEQDLHNLIADLVPDDAKTVLDFACGTGALLATTSGKHPNARVTGMEPDPVKASVARRRLSYRGEAAAVEHVDILAGDPLAERTFDAVISIPPFGRKVDAVNKERMRGLPYGAVRGVADAAWPQLAEQALTPEGRAFLVLPHSLTTDDRADHIRRELIRQGLLSAVVTLPEDAHPSSKALLDLWVLDRRHERTANILMVDYSYGHLSEEDTYADLIHELHRWLNGYFSDEDEIHFIDGYARWEEVDPIQLLGPTVILDPQYWRARATTPTAAADLIEAVEEAATAVEEATTALDDARDEILFFQIPDCQASPDLLTMITLRDARGEDLIQVVRRTSASKEWPTLTLAGAEAMRDGDQPEPKAVEPRVSDQPPEDAVRQGDVLVWATTDRQVRTAISTATGLVPRSGIAILRCGPELDPGYVALALAARRNAVHATGSTTPKLHVLELSLPLIPIRSQRQIAEYTTGIRKLADAARHVVQTADAFEQTLSDAAGSGKVVFANKDNE